MNFWWFLSILVSATSFYAIGYKVGSKKMENFMSEQVRDIIVAALSSGLSGDVEDGNS